MTPKRKSRKITKESGISWKIPAQSRNSQQWALFSARILYIKWLKQWQMVLKTDWLMGFHLNLLLVPLKSQIVGVSLIIPKEATFTHPKSGTKLIRIAINGDHWLDPSTFRVMFDVVNTDTDATHRLRPLLAPWAFFRRLRVLAGGQLVEDID